MRVVLIGEDTCLGAGLRVHLHRWGRHEVKILKLEAGRWKSERKLRKSLRQLAADILIDLRFCSKFETFDASGYLDIKYTEWLARACEKEKIFLLHVSNPVVFSGLKRNPYIENDIPDAISDIGQLFVKNEEVLRNFCSDHIILRLGPVFAAYGSNIFTDFIAQLERKEELHLQAKQKESPLHASDGARVISGIIDQISAGAKEIGTFHYCGTEAISSYEFCEMILSSVLRLNLIQLETVIYPIESDEPARNFALDCRKIQNGFAIRQISWTQFISEAIKNYYSAR